MLLIARLLDAAFAPLLRRMERRLAPRLLALHEELAGLRAQTTDILRYTRRPILTERYYAEMADLATLPYGLFDAHDGPVGIVGLQAREVAPLIAHSLVLPWGRPDMPESAPLSVPILHSLLLLNEYSLLETLYAQLLTPRQLRQRLIFPTRNLLLPEAGYRTLLHQAGFMEICRVHADTLTGTLRFDAVSHMMPISGAPYFPEGEALDVGEGPTWLLASRHTGICSAAAD